MEEGDGGGLCVDLTVLELSHSVDQVGLDSKICLPLPPRDLNSDIVLGLSFELASLPNAVKVGTDAKPSKQDSC